MIRALIIARADGKENARQSCASKIICAQIAGDMGECGRL